MTVDANNNTGYCNTGYWNTGNRNTGNRNTGYWNTGDCNTGDWNTGNRNTGFFCTETPNAVFFDKPTNLTFEQATELIPHVELPVGVEYVEAKNMTDAERAEYPQAVKNGWLLRNRALSIQQSFPIAWAKMTAQERSKWTSLPNFDADKFLITNGVDVRQDRKIVIVTTVDGKQVQVYADEIK